MKWLIRLGALLIVIGALILMLLSRWFDPPVKYIPITTSQNKFEISIDMTSVFGEGNDLISCQYVLSVYQMSQKRDTGSMIITPAEHGFREIVAGFCSDRQMEALFDKNRDLICGELSTDSCHEVESITGNAH